MTKPAKLYSLLLKSTDRSVDFRDFLAMMEAFGFANVRTKGSHRAYLHPSCKALLVVQPKGKDANAIRFASFLVLSKRTASLWMTDDAPLSYQRFLVR